jgi:cobalt transporter subunit CbtB
MKADYISHIGNDLTVLGENTKILTLPVVFQAAILGVLVLYGVAFLSMDAVHNGAHDTRHSFAFPCH